MLLLKMCTSSIAVSPCLHADSCSCMTCDKDIVLEHVGVSLGPYIERQMMLDHR
jgi:hypothetical protein